MTIPGVIVMENTMRKEKRIFLILMIGICLSGMLIIKKTTVIRGQENTVSHVTAPKDIPAVAVEINKSSEVICDKLSEITYTVYTDSDTLHIPVQWNVSTVNMKLPGVYTVKGILKLPPEYDLGENQQSTGTDHSFSPVSGKTGNQYLLQTDSGRPVYFSMAGERRYRFYGGLSEKG